MIGEIYSNCIAIFHIMYLRKNVENPSQFVKTTANEKVGRF